MVRMVALTSIFEYEGTIPPGEVFSVGWTHAYENTPLGKQLFPKEKIEWITDWARARQLEAQGKARPVLKNRQPPDLAGVVVFAVKGGL